MREIAVAVEGKLATCNDTGNSGDSGDTGDSGARVRRQFCGTCGSPVITRVESPPEIMFIKAETLDDTSILKPAFHCHAKSTQHRVDLGDVPGFETVPRGL